MERVAVLTLCEHDRLLWRKKLKTYFQATGDWRAYTLPPSIILPYVKDISAYFDIADGIFRYKGEIETLSSFRVLRAENSALKGEYGLFISYGSENFDYVFEEGKVKVDGIALYEIKETSTKLIQHRPLRIS